MSTSIESLFEMALDTTADPSALHTIMEERDVCDRVELDAMLATHEALEECDDCDCEDALVEALKTRDGEKKFRQTLEDAQRSLTNDIRKYEDLCNDALKRTTICVQEWTQAFVMLEKTRSLYNDTLKSLRDSSARLKCQELIIRKCQRDVIVATFKQKRSSSPKRKRSLSPLSEREVRRCFE